MTDTAEAGVSGQIGHCLPEELLHLVHPFTFLWVALVGFLVILGSVDLQRIFLKFGPCLKLAMGGLGKTFFNSGLSISIVLWCLANTSDILGKAGLKSKGAITLSESLTLCFFKRAKFLFSELDVPGMVNFELLKTADQ